jgi:uncharacterized protein with HEPN domain
MTVAAAAPRLWLKGCYRHTLAVSLQLHLTGEYGELAAAISRDIYVESPDVSWEQIAGLDEAKR